MFLGTKTELISCFLKIWKENKVIKYEMQRTKRETSSNWWLAQRRCICKALLGGHSSTGVQLCQAILDKIYYKFVSTIQQLWSSFTQALRLVRSLNELKNELRSLTVRVDGKKETVDGLLKTQRWFFYNDQYIGKEYELVLTRTNFACTDFSCLIILPLSHFLSYLEGFSMLLK